MPMPIPLLRALLLVPLLFVQFAFAQSASFDPASNTLTLAEVGVGGISYQNAVVHISSFGTLRLDDPSVGAGNEYDMARNILRLPQVRVGNVTYSRVSLSGPSFTVSSVGGATSGTGIASQKWAVDISADIVGYAVVPIRVNNVVKPASSAEFCKEENYRLMDQVARQYQATVRVTSCSFSGSSGVLSAVLTFLEYGEVVPLTVRYRYVAL